MSLGLFLEIWYMFLEILYCIPMVHGVFWPKLNESSAEDEQA